MTNGKQILVIIGLVILIMGISQNNGKKESSITSNFLWNGLNVEASFTGSSSGDRGCCSGNGVVSPSIDTNGSIQLSASTSWNSCTGCEAGSTGILIRIPNPKSYKQIFVEYSGNIRADGSVSSNCASASASSSIKQEGGNTVPIFSKSISCQGSDSLPSNMLVNIDGDFVSIPSSSSAFQLIGNNDLIINFGAGTGNSATGRSANSQIDIKPITFIPKEPQADCIVLKSGILASINAWASNPAADTKTQILSEITQWASSC